MPEKQYIRPYFIRDMEMEPLKTFIIYSSKDRELREELEGHLRPLVDLGWLDLWSDK